MRFCDTDWHSLGSNLFVEERASLLVDIFQRSSGLDSIEKFLSKESKFNSNVREVTVEYVESVRLAEKRDLDGLWQQLLDTVPDKTFERLNSRSDVPWKAERILKHLIAAKGNRPFLLKKVESAAEGDGLALVALGLMRDPEVLRFVKERLSTLDAMQNSQAYGHFDSFYAAVLLGSPEANKLVDGYADVAVNQWSPARRAIDWGRTYR